MTFLLLWCAVPLPVLQDTVSCPFEENVLAQFTFGWSDGEWRKKMGLADPFTREGSTESRFFWKGAVYQKVRPVYHKTDAGPYAGQDNVVNAAMACGEIEDETFLTLLPDDDGLFLCLRGESLAAHEEEYDTRVRYTVMLNCEEWPDDFNCDFYYIEDHRAGGVAQVVKSYGTGTVQVRDAAEGGALRFFGHAEPALELKGEDVQLHFTGGVVWGGW